MAKLVFVFLMTCATCVAQSPRLTPPAADSAAHARFSRGLACFWERPNLSASDLNHRTFDTVFGGARGARGFGSLYDTPDSSFKCVKQSMRLLDCDSIAVVPVISWNRRLVFSSGEVPVRSVLYYGVCVSDTQESHGLVVLSKVDDGYDRAWNAHSFRCESILVSDRRIDSTALESFLAGQRAIESTFYVGDSVCSKSRPVRCFELESIQVDYDAVTEIFGGMTESMTRYIKTAPASR